MSVEELNKPVCRHCGSEEIHSIERATSWRYVDWVYSPGSPDREVDGGIVPGQRPGWYTGDDWGDDVGDADAESVGIACGGCYAEIWFEQGQSSKDLITTRGAYNRAHPVRRWKVTLTTWTDKPDGTREKGERRRIVRARDEREACDVAAAGDSWARIWHPKAVPYGKAA